jgi:hypothetical protein
MIIVDPDDVTILVIGNNSISKLLVHSNVLGVRGGFVESFSARCIRDGVMKTRPEHLVAEFVIAAVELRIGDPDGERRVQELGR